MQDSLTNHVNSLSGIDNKEPENKFIDNMRSMADSLSQSINKYNNLLIKFQRLIRKYHNLH